MSRKRAKKRRLPQPDKREYPMLPRLRAMGKEDGKGI